MKGKAVGEKEVNYDKIFSGLILLGFGITSVIVFPKAVLSQTITTYDEAAIVNPTAVVSQPDPNQVAEAYKSYLLTTKAQKLVGKFGGPCVTFARNFTGASSDDVSGMARNVKTNTTTPEVGDILKTDESSAGHLAVIIALDGDTLTVVDSNYNLDQIIHIRTLNINDPKILGYIKL